MGRLLKVNVGSGRPSKVAKIIGNVGLGSTRGTQQTKTGVTVYRTRKDGVTNVDQTLPGNFNINVLSCL